MSLVAHALAITATGALIEALPSWVRVEMEPHEPIALAEDSQTILVAVFVGDETTTVSGRRWSLAQPTIELVVQVILPPKVRAILGDVECEFDTHKGGTRALYALIHEGLRRAFTSPAGTWGALLQAVALDHPEALHGMPGRADRPGVGKLPIAIIDYSIPCRTIAPPPFGLATPQPWTDIVAAMRADEAFTPAEADFFEVLVRGFPLTDELAALALAGLSRAEGTALGLAPPDGLDASPPAASAVLVGPLGDVEEILPDAP